MKARTIHHFLSSGTGLWFSLVEQQILDAFLTARLSPSPVAGEITVKRTRGEEHLYDFWSTDHSQKQESFLYVPCVPLSFVNYIFWLFHFWGEVVFVLFLNDISSRASTFSLTEENIS